MSQLTSLQIQAIIHHTNLSSIYSKWKLSDGGKIKGAASFENVSKQKLAK